jgi:hypothetical protein
VIGKKDYSCEIIALCVLTVLSELSHFWYIMIAILVGLSLQGILIFLSKIYLQTKMATGSNLHNPPPGVFTGSPGKIVLEPPQGSGASLPAVEG